MAMKSAVSDLVRPAVIGIAVAALAVSASLTDRSRRASADDGTVPIVAAADAATVPDQPLNVEGKPGNGMAIVSWNAPASDGGAEVLAYVVSSEGLRDRRVGGGARRAVVTGLVNGESYEFSVKAVNAMGAGDTSALSAPVTPMSPDANVNGNDTGNGRGISVMGNRTAIGRSLAVFDESLRATSSSGDAASDERADIAKLHFAAAMDRMRSLIEAAREHNRTAREHGSGMATGRRQHLPIQLPSVESVLTAREAASGLATGKRQHDPILPVDGTDVPKDRAAGQSSGQRLLTPETITEIAAGIHAEFAVADDDAAVDPDQPGAAVRARLKSLAAFVEEFRAVDSALAAAAQ